MVTKLANCQWVRERHNLLLTGPTGIGKSWLACAFGHQTCREGLNFVHPFKLGILDPMADKVIKRRGRPASYRAENPMDKAPSRIRLRQQQLESYKAAAGRGEKILSDWVRTALDNAARC